jgi:hypothetical protein
MKEFIDTITGPSCREEEIEILSNKKDITVVISSKAVSRLYSNSSIVLNYEKTKELIEILQERIKILKENK